MKERWVLLGGRDRVEEGGMRKVERRDKEQDKNTKG